MLRLWRACAVRTNVSNLVSIDKEFNHVFLIIWSDFRPMSRQFKSPAFYYTVFNSLSPYIIICQKLKIYYCCKGVSTIKADFPASVPKAKLHSTQDPIQHVAWWLRHKHFEKSIVSFQDIAGKERVSLFSRLGSRPIFTAEKEGVPEQG